MTQQGPTPIPLTQLDGYQTHRGMVALVHLLGSLGPFDSFTCSLTYQGGEGWSSADAIGYIGSEVLAQEFDVDGEMTTDPVLILLTLMNQVALTWHLPTLFPAA